MITTPVSFAKYDFRERSGYILTDDLFAIGHTALVPPWTDSQIHIHENSEEYYLLLQGELRFVVGEAGITLKPREMLVVKPRVPHAIVGGTGIIEHLGFRAPGAKDKQIIGDIPQVVPQDSATERELRCDWGYRIPLALTEDQNCWLVGNGTARYASQFLSLANLNFPTNESANAGIGMRHRLHLHQASWEYYIVLRGTETLQIEDALVNIEPGELVVIPPKVKHTLHSRQAPFEGFTIRVPCLDWNDKVELNASSIS